MPRRCRSGRARGARRRLDLVSDGCSRRRRRPWSLRCAVTLCGRSSAPATGGAVPAAARAIRINPAQQHRALRCPFTEVGSSFSQRGGPGGARHLPLPIRARSRSPWSGLETPARTTCGKPVGRRVMPLSRRSPRLYRGHFQCYMPRRHEEGSVDLSNVGFRPPDRLVYVRHGGEYEVQIPPGETPASPRRSFDRRSSYDGSG